MTMTKDEFSHYKTIFFHCFLHSGYSTEVVKESVQNFRNARPKVNRRTLIHFSYERTPASFISASEDKPGFCVEADFIWKMNEAKFWKKIKDGPIEGHGCHSGTTLLCVSPTKFLYDLGQDFLNHSFFKGLIEYMFLIFWN